MKFYYSALLLFFFSSVFSQNKNYKYYKVEYDLKYKVDTSSANSYHENFILNFNSVESFFCSEKIINGTKDSGVSLAEGSIDINKIIKNETLFADKIIFDEQNGLRSFLNFNSGTFYYSQDTPVWEILGEKKTIKNIVCRKAKTYFLGRVWCAWFSEEYPFSYGPYKFVGLPGLILEVHDQENTYNYTAVSIKESTHSIKSLFEDLNNGKLITKKEYFQVLDNLLYDTNTLTKFSSVFEKFPPEKIQQYRRSLDEKRKKRSNFPIDKDIH